MKVGIREVVFTMTYDNETYDGPEMFCVVAGAVFDACSTAARWRSSTQEGGSLPFPDAVHRRLRRGSRLELSFPRRMACGYAHALT